MSVSSLRESRVWPLIGYVVLLFAGVALLYLPLHTHWSLDNWARELREHGQPAVAHVYDQETKRGGRDTTMFFRYELDGREHRQEVGCVQVCLEVGETVPIWVSRTDPGDFVTDFDQLSGHRGRLQGGFGVVGFAILVLTIPATIVKLRRDKPWRARRRPQPDQPVGPARIRIRSKHKRR